MCCFSGTVRFVGSTRIFARMTEASRQAIVYQMKYGADRELAMILPLPVSEGTAEDALRFINLKSYPAFFDDLRSGFPQPVAEATRNAGALAGNTLKVETVGDFEASFVPKPADFDRLDARFRIPKATWDKIPLYADYGFAVFKLRKDAQSVHPMAFTFPTRHPDKLFFPTVHIHDGEVHEKEEFDHALYCQVNRGGMFAMMKWDESDQPAGGFTKVEKSAGLLVKDKHVYRKLMAGIRKNEDVFLATT